MSREEDKIVTVWDRPEVPTPKHIRTSIRDLRMAIDLATFPLPPFEDRLEVLELVLPLSIQFYGDDEEEFCNDPTYYPPVKETSDG